jgi:hypothetical protein
VVADKPPLPPVEKQALYDALQPDAGLMADPPPAFIVYAANDPVVPVENGLRLQRAYLDRGGPCRAARLRRGPARLRPAHAGRSAGRRLADAVRPLAGPGGGEMVGLEGLEPPTRPL